jgi:small subunit ribosomal protein S17
MNRSIGVTVSQPKRTCEDDLCPFHGKLSIRGKILIGTTISSKAHKMIVVSREYPRLVRKYKRYERSRSNVHAYLPSCIDVNQGDEVKIAECKPISKTVSFVTVEVIKSGI